MRRWLALALLAGLALTADDAAARSSNKAGQSNNAPIAAKAPEPADAKNAQPAAPGWRYHCENTARKAPLTCVVEETAVLTQTGQILAGVTIRVAQEAGPAVALVQIPVGVFLPSGAQLQIDEGTKLDLPLQTCEQRGCFASTTLDTNVLDGMRTGKTLKVSFDNLNKQKLTISLPLNGFGAAFDQIK